jgi:hypothetical protein
MMAVRSFSTTSRPAGGNPSIPSLRHRRSTSPLRKTMPEDSRIARIEAAGKALLPIFGVLTAITYAALRAAYSQFYDHFGILPEEVGFGKAELLSQALAGPLIVFIVVFILILVVDLIRRLMSSPIRTRRNSIPDTPSGSGSPHAIG